MKKLVARAQRVAGWASATVPGKVVRKFSEDQGPNQAVVLAWNMLFSFFPIVLFLAAIAGLVLAHLGLASRSEIEAAALSRLPQNPTDTRGALETIKQQSGVFFLVGLGGLVWSGASLFGAMEQAFDLIFHVRQRAFVRQKVMSVLMMLLFAGLAALVVISSSALALIKDLPLVPAAVTNGVAVYVLQPLFGIAAGVVLFGAIYLVVPNRKQKLGETWPGALLAGAGFYVLTLAFPIYLRLAGSGMNQYGRSFAFLFIVMTFFYFIGLITMFGVELNAVLYPVPVEQPANAALLAPPQHPERARARRAPAVESSPAEASTQQPPPDRRPRVQRWLYGAAGALIGFFAVTRHRRRGPA